MRTINTFLFERNFALFKKFVESESGEDFSSFFDNSYTNYHEAYKEEEIFPLAHQKLDIESWSEDIIGQATIATNVLQAIELNEKVTIGDNSKLVRNNLVSWEAKYGPQNTPQAALQKALDTKVGLKEIEQTLYDVFKSDKDEETFNALLNVFGQKYGLLSYLFFLKNKTKYAPVSQTSAFDQAFARLGLDFKTSRKCSWENYTEFNSHIRTVQHLLKSRLSSDTTFIDAHSFLWMIVSYGIENVPTEIAEAYDNLPDIKSKESVIQSRVGQGTFRKNVIHYWAGQCAVTGCDDVSLLIASHIKPWAQSEINEILDTYNGLLLSPNLDKLFDRGLISFQDDGSILISTQLSVENQQRLNVDTSLKLQKIENGHHQFLDYHRSNIFQG